MIDREGWNIRDVQVSEWSEGRSLLSAGRMRRPPPAIVDGAAEELAREAWEADRQAAERDDASLDQPRMQFPKSGRLTTLAQCAMRLKSILPDSAMGERK